MDGSHPLAQALPPVVVLPLSQVNGLQASLDLLFAETEQVRCGHLILANRLFEVVLIQLLRWLSLSSARGEDRRWFGDGAFIASAGQGAYSHA